MSLFILKTVFLLTLLKQYSCEFEELFKWQSPSPGYPTEQVDRLINDNPSIFGTVLNESYEKGSLEKSPCELCSVRRLTDMIPVMARANVNEEWQFVVKSDKYYQKLTIEKCVNEPSKCTPELGENNPLLGSKTPVCKQVMSSIQMIVLNEEMDKLESIKIPYESACVCKYYQGR